MKIALAQNIAVKGDVEKNIAHHLMHIKNAVERKADLILFPELSITGYEPELAADLAMELDDRRFEAFKDIARSENLVIVAGAPIRSGEGQKPFIGSIIFIPNGTTRLYIKRYLHEDEELFFSSRSSMDQIEHMGQKINFAICADITNPQHPKDAARDGCNLYLASVLIGQKNIDYEVDLLRTYAKEYGMTTFMSNYGGESGGYISGGRTGAWSKNGEAIEELEHLESGLIVVEV